MITHRITHRSLAAALAFAVAAPLAAMLLQPAAAAAQVSYSVSHRGVLGIMTQSVEVRGEASRQRVVMQVVPESPAARAGVMAGDTIVRINGLAATSQVINSPFEPGDTVVLRIRRDGRERDITIVAAERSPRFEAFTMRGVLTDSVIREVGERMAILRAHVDTVGMPSIVLERLRGDSTIVLRFGNDTTHFYRFGPGFEGTIEIDSLRRRFMHSDSVFRRFHVDSLRNQAWRLDERTRMLLDSLPGRPFGAGDAHVWFRQGDSISGMGPGEIFASGISMGMRAVAGAELSELNPGLAGYFGTDAGVLVLNARDGTPAARAGLQGGDVIMQVEQTRVASIQQLRRAIARAQPGTTVQLHVLRQGQTIELSLAR
jgi:membrane-associated protease RseP (regulator of RpoE activity)